MPTGLRDRLRQAFGLEDKASKTAKLIAWVERRAAGVDAARSRQPRPRRLQQNAIVYRAVRMIAEAAASVPLFLFDGESEVDEHPLLSLLRQAEPGASAGRICSRPGTGICSSPATPISRR